LLRFTRNEEFLMKKLRQLILRFGGLFNKQRMDRELDAEIESHVHMHIEDNLRLGMTPEEARRKAVIKLGGVESTKEAYRDQRGLPVLETLWQDIRYGARISRKNAASTAVAVLTLALGIGANTAIFSLIHAALLRELPFPEAGQLAVVWAANPLKPGMDHVPLANADIAELRDHNKSFARIAAFLPRSADLSEGGDDPERIGGAGVTAGFFETLGVTPLLGRTLTADEEAFGGPPVALISYGLWQRRFGGDRGILGKGISIDGEKRTIIGILPPDFDFPRGAEWPAFFPFAGRTEIWLPLAMRPQNDNSGWSYWQSPERMLVMLGRLKPVVTQRQAQAEMDALAAKQASAHPDTHKGTILKVISLHEQLSGKLYKALLLLFAAASLLLIIACTNVANLLLARGVARQQEMAVRIALGARRGRLTRQLLTEGVLLGTLGSGCALLVAQGCLKTFLALSPMPPSRLDHAALDPMVLGFTALVALATSAVFGLAPALQTSRSDLRKSLHESGRDASGAVHGNARAWLVATEVALALVLLTTAGFMVRSFMRVLAVQTGFRPQSVLAFDVGLPSSRYGNDASQIRFFQQLIERLEALPGARSSGAISYLPLGGGENMGRFTIEGEEPPSPGKEPFAERRWVTPGYFATMGIPVRRGRVFTPRDSADQPKVVVINETLAKQFFNARDPIGQRLKAGGAVRTIVGVVSDVRSSSLESEVRPQFYVPNAQWGWGAMTIVLHTEGDPIALASAARRELKALDPLIPAANLRTMQQVVSSASSARRFNMALLAFFAFVALLLTMMGIYGVVAFLVGRRVREIGVRMALGAQRGEVLRMILSQGMKPILCGSTVGIIGSLASARLLRSQLFGISPFDPLTLGIILLLLFTAGLLACWLPARSASKVDPMVALRYE
jgi:putative ABC transport system permease protein